MTTEMGKTLRSAEEEAVKCAWGCRYYAAHAERSSADEPVETPASRISFVTNRLVSPGRDAVELSVLAVFRFIASGFEWRAMLDF